MQVFPKEYVLKLNYWVTHTASGLLTAKSIATAEPRLGPTNIMGLPMYDFQNYGQINVNTMSNTWKEIKREEQN